MQNQTPERIQFAHSNALSAVILRYGIWRDTGAALGFGPEDVALVATRDPRGCWALEISQGLFAETFVEEV